MEYPEMYVTTMLGLVVCTACVITGTGGGLPSHCYPSYDNRPHCEKCEGKWYGENCTKACSSGCNEYGCNKKTGRCVSCKAGYHSLYCTLECPPNCLNDSHGPAKCDQDTAHCTNCQPTWWGSNCTNKCDSNCKDGVCDFEDGHCHECKVGKAGEKCSEDCPMGCWLHECHRDNMTCTGGCHRDNMTCTGGCTPGYFGERCDKKCNDNCKGVECSASGATGTSSPCAVCQGTCVCHQITGQCQSCKTGFRGDTCDELCPEQCPDCSNATCIIRNSNNNSNSSIKNSSNSDRITGSDDQMTPISQIVVPIALFIVIVLVALVIYKFRSNIFRRCRRSRPLSDEADTCLRA